MRKLLLLFVCVLASIGAWAESYYTTLTDTKGSVKVARITLEEGGVLADALASINDLAQYQYIHISSPGTGATQISLTADDITALSNLNAETIEMQKLNVSEAFTFSNSYVKYVVLPDDWTKDEVKAAGLALSTSANFDAAISMSAGNASFNVTGGTEPSLVAYVNHPGTLKDAINHNYWDQQDYKTIGEGGYCGKLRKLIALGNICAKDISRAGVYDENGHYVTNGMPDENSQTWNSSTAGGNYCVGVVNGVVVSTATDGALSGCHDLNVIDLSGAYVPDEYCTDIVVGFNGIGIKSLREVWMPEDPRFKTVPADYLNINTDNLHMVCIPGNIETIKTRAFAAQGCRINYIWTTGPDGNTKYDNGAAFVTGDNVDNAVTTVKFMDPRHDEDDTEWQAFNNPTDYNNFQYGTITLPANLRLIERFAFAGCTSVKDVYVLNVHAPECHVDAFSTNQYDANNTVVSGYVKDGIVTRDAYRQGDFKEFKFMTVLHYPKETTDPDIQRYTDPTREYSIATGERDDKGNMIYFPNHSEVSYAYLQGSYGYVWKAWDDSRNWYDQSLTLGYGDGWPLDKASHVATSEGTRWQNAANNNWTGKADRSFYDVTRGDNNQPGEANAPSGLAPYYNTEYMGYNLYPAPVSVQSNYVYVRDDNGDYVKDISDANLFRAYVGSADDGLERYSRKQTVVTDGQGNPEFEGCTDGNYVEDYEWVEDPAGGFVKESVLDGYTSTAVLVDGVDTYYSDAEGTTAVIPQVGAGMFVRCGDEDAYEQVDNNVQKPGQREYYVTSDGGQTYTLTNLQFSGNPVFYYATGNKVTNSANTTVNNNNVLKFGVDRYYSDEARTTEATPILNINNGTLYYKDTEGYHSTTTFVPGQGDYYLEYSHAPGQYYEVGDYNNQVYLDGVYYYGVEEDEYLRATELEYGTTYYQYQNWNNTYVPQTSFDWYMVNSGTYYYVSGNRPAYCSAQGEEYDASTTYYSDKNGTEATTIRLNTQYFIPNYVDEYRTAQTGDEGLPHYDKNYLGTYHPATAADAGEDTYCMKTVDYVSDTPITYSVQNDYRGWHQFVLTAYAANTIVPYEYLRSFITDNDWWTVCEPFDMRYSDMVMFFGTDRRGFEKKIPYLSKLTYVIRDVEKGKITLMFSKNLMEYMEYEMVDGEKTPISDGVHKHGWIDEETKWPATKDGKALGEKGYDPVILHAGVPYLIKPNMEFIEGTNKYNRQFSIAKRDNPDLYARLKDAEELPGDDQMEMVYAGEYTVPSYVVGSGSEGALAEGTIAAGTKSIRNSDGSSFIYKDTDNGGEQITYGGKKVDYKLSNDYTYTFVGTFYRSVMPQYCYFLGWNPQLNGGQGGAAFWYSRAQDTTGWNWNNETGIIIPNWDQITTESVKKIHKATAISDPARWTITNAQGVSALSPDDFPSAGGAKSYGMEFGATNYFQYDEATGISELKELPLVGKLSIYNTNGVYMGSSLKGLAKGVYIVNGKKYVVK